MNDWVIKGSGQSLNYLITNYRKRRRSFPWRQYSKRQRSGLAPREREQLTITGDQQIGAAVVGEFEEFLIIRVVAQRQQTSGASCGAACLV